MMRSFQEKESKHDDKAGGVLPQIIVLTTSKQVQVELEMRERVLLKPFHVRELLALIRQVIPRASRSEEGPFASGQ